MREHFESHVEDVSLLAQPLHFEFSGRTAKNRFLKAAMTEKLSSWSVTDLQARGIPSPELAQVYRRWGEGGAGVILTGNVMVTFQDIEAPGNAIIPLEANFHDERFEGFRRMAEEAKRHGSLILAQVSHAGRQAEARFQPNPISASDVQLLKTDFPDVKFAKPRAATKSEIKDVLDCFTHAAIYLHKAGFDGMELHAAHGYLLSQFISEATNHRNDEYGGSIVNRARTVTDIAKSIRSQLPGSSGFILGVKVNSVEFQEHGIDPDGCRELCKLLEEAEFDFVELSGGNYETISYTYTLRESTKKREAFFLDFAEKITPGLRKTKSYVTGGFRTIAGMVDALRTVDGVGLGRSTAEEFTVVKDLLNGDISGTVKTRLDVGSTALCILAAGVQIRQVSKGQPTFDSSSEDEINTFLEDIETWKEKAAADEKLSMYYGFPDCPTLNAVPY